MSEEQLADWPRRFYQGPGGQPFLFYAVYGAFPQVPALAKAGVEVTLGRSKRGSKVAVRRVAVGDDPGRGVTIPPAPAVPPGGVQATGVDRGDGRVSSPSS